MSIVSMYGVDVLRACIACRYGVNVNVLMYWQQRMLCRFVHAQQLEAMNVSLTFHMAMGLRPRPPACIPLQLSRHLERRLADVEGVASVRHWLHLIGTCAPLPPPPPPHVASGQRGINH